jgi:hypothetical protein
MDAMEKRNKLALAGNRTPAVQPITLETYCDMAAERPE